MSDEFGGSVGAPVGACAVIGVNLRFARTVAPVEFLVGRVERGLGKLVVGQVDLVGLERGAVLHARPRHRQMFLPYAEDAAEAENGVGDVAADLVDHQPLNRADLSAV